MGEENYTTNSAFILFGFQNISQYKFPVFFLFLVIVGVTLSGNVFISILILTSHQLHSPMYIFLSHLSITDILTTLVIVPNMLRVLLEEGSAITLEGCIAQLFLYSVSELVQCSILTIMSYDRYLAICNPLHYISIMNFRLVNILVLCSWAVGFLIALILVIQIYMLKFCGPKIIDHIFCDHLNLLEMSCSSTYSLKLEDYTLAALITLTSFILISFTYVKILLCIFRNSTITKRKKAFSTCISHLSVLIIFYGSLIAVYEVPAIGNQKKFLSLLYTILTPLSNPVIYTLRSQEIRSAFKQIIIASL